MASRNQLGSGKYRKNSPRLPDENYSHAGAYFVTVCLRRKASIWLSQIKYNADEASVHLAQARQILERVWLGIPDRYARVSVDEYVVMPNHFHGILILGNVEFDEAVDEPSDKDLSHDLVFEQRRVRRRKMLLPKVMGYFKMNASKQVNQGYRRKGRLWQRSYHDQVIRDAVHLENVRRYIERNPEEWRRPR